MDGRKPDRCQACSRVTEDLVLQEIQTRITPQAAPESPTYARAAVRARWVCADTRLCLRKRLGLEWHGHD
ncbi:hypothetical protein GCM10027053_05420 [Intrasporangium mesophilum]